MLSKNYWVALASLIWMVGLTLWILSHSVDGLEIPVHFNIQGQADRYAPVGEALWTGVGLAAGSLALIHFLPLIDPRIKNVDDTRPAIRGMANAVVLFLALVHGGMGLSALGYGIDVVQSVVIGLGGLYLIMGNYVAKTRSNFFIGIRTPWTLSSDKVWMKTHRLAGRLMVPASLIILMIGGLGLHVELFAFLMIVLLTAVFVPVVYSWYAYRQEMNG